MALNQKLEQSAISRTDNDANSQYKGGDIMDHEHQSKFSDRRSFGVDGHPGKEYGHKFDFISHQARSLRLDANGNLNIVDENDFPIIGELEAKGKTSPTRSFLKTKNTVTDQYNLHPLAELVNELRSGNLDEGFYDNLTVDKVFAL